MWLRRLKPLPLVSLCLLGLIWGELSLALPSSAGPTSPDEAELLWKDGQTAFTNQNYQKAINAFQRLVDRYPGYTGYLESHFYLGKSFIETHKTHEAIPPLKYYVDAAPPSKETVQAQLLLGNAYLEEKKYHEAELIALEVERKAPQIKLPPDLLLEMLLLKSQALLKLKHENQSYETILTAAKQISAETESQIKAQTWNLQMTLQLLRCGRFPSKGKLNDAQLRTQLDRRGTCILEAMLLFEKILETRHDKMSQQAGVQLEGAFAEYHHSCKSPPIHRNNSKARAELADRLVLDCRQKTRSASELLETWVQKLGPSKKSGVQTLSKTLESLSSRTSL